MVTTKGWGVVVGWGTRAPSHRVETPAPLSEIHHGLVVARERPQALSRLASIFAVLAETLAELAV